MLKSIARALNLSAEALFAQVALMHESTHPDDDATETGNGEIRGRHRGVFVAASGEVSSQSMRISVAPTFPCVQVPILWRPPTPRTRWVLVAGRLDANVTRSLRMTSTMSPTVREWAAVDEQSCCGATAYPRCLDLRTTTTRSLPRTCSVNERRLRRAWPSLHCLLDEVSSAAYSAVSGSFGPAARASFGSVNRGSMRSAAVCRGRCSTAVSAGRSRPMCRRRIASE
jgi:hypothetical protein